MQMLSKRSLGVLVGIAALVVATASRAQTTDPIMGNWTLDVAKSTYKPGPAPKSSKLTIEPVGKGFKASIDAVNADGSPLKWGFTTLRDGKEEAPVTGNPMFDVITSTRESATAGTNVYKKAGKVVMTTKAAISADGQSMTADVNGHRCEGTGD